MNIKGERYRFIGSREQFTKAFGHLPHRDYEGPDLYNVATGLMMDQPQRGEGLCAPMVFGDIPDYRSPVDGKLISGRRQRRYDLAKHGCIEMDSPEARARHRGVSTKYAPTLSQRKKKREKIKSSDLDDRVLHDKLRAVANGARGI